MTEKIRLTLQYVGTAYAGWQAQPGRPTVQTTVEAALEKVLGEAVRVHASGRTDAGVHARVQVAHFETSRSLPPGKLPSALNHFLPWDIRVADARVAPGEFHARLSPHTKEYRYFVHNGTFLPPHLYPFSLLVRDPLEIEAMRLASTSLVGTHDFAALRTIGSSAGSTVRTITAAEVLDEDPGIVFRFEADGFLYRMVRTIVGTLIEVGRGRRDTTVFTELLAGGERSLAGPVVAGRGLHLWRVSYEGETGGGVER